MKFNRLLVLGALATLSFTACKNDKKAEDEKEKMEAKAEAEKMEKENAMKEAEAEKMKMEETSIAAVAMNSEDHTTLVAALKAADLATMLKQDEGPFTVFAPSNAAFDRLPAGTVDTLLKPENKGKLQSVLQYHVVSGNISSAQLVKMIKDNNGFYMMETVNGDELRAEINSAGNVTITDGRGKKSTITATDLKASNGTVHVVNTVMMKS